MSKSNTSILLDREEMSSLYADYIASINSRTVAEDLPRFCHENVQYNGRRLSRSAYQANIDAAIEHIPDVSFHVEQIAVDTGNQSIAARIAISGVLKKPFDALGIAPDGPGNASQVTINEYIFYQLSDGKIHSVWTLIHSQMGYTIQP